MFYFTWWSSLGKALNISLMCSSKTNLAATNNGHNSKLFTSSDNDFHVYNVYLNEFIWILNLINNKIPTSIVIWVDTVKQYWSISWLKYLERIIVMASCKGKFDNNLADSKLGQSLRKHLIHTKKGRSVGEINGQYNL